MFVPYFLIDFTSIFGGRKSLVVQAKDEKAAEAYLVLSIDNEPVDYTQPVQFTRLVPMVKGIEKQVNPDDYIFWSKAGDQ